jgi:hypothetical protein
VNANAQHDDDQGRRDDNPVVAVSEQILQGIALQDYFQQVYVTSRFFMSFAVP